jgi:hypothetical protein
MILQLASGDLGDFSLDGITDNAVHLELNVTIFDPNRKTTDLDARTVRPSTVGEAKTPCMPGTRDDAVLHITVAQRSSHVRANIVDGVVFPLVTEYCDQLAVNVNRLAYALGQVAGPTYRSIVCHPLSSFWKADWTKMVPIVMILSERRGFAPKN